MHNHIRIFVLLFSLFALSANSARACGSHNADHVKTYHGETAKQSCCSKGAAGATEASNDQSQDTKCPCEQDKKGCHCPGCGMVCHAGAALAFDISDLFRTIGLQNTSLQKQAFYFAQHMPEDVYLSIWQPPKIAA